MYQNVDYWYTTESGEHIPVVNSNTSPSSKKIDLGRFQPISNRKELTTFVKNQINLDLDTIATERQSRPRSFLNIDSRKLSPSDFNNLKGVLQKYGHNISVESNGVYDYAISYEKRK